MNIKEGGVKKLSEIMTPSEVAERLKVTERTIYKYLANGELEAVKIGRVWRITQEQLKSFLEKKTQNRRGQ